MMDTKAEFEKFVIKHDPSGHCTNLLAMNEAGTNYLHPHVDIAWISWQASRAAIEVEKEPEHEWMGDYPSHDSFLDGYANGWNDCVDAITPNGIRIKGKTE